MRAFGTMPVVQKMFILEAARKLDVTSGTGNLANMVALDGAEDEELGQLDGHYREELTLASSRSSSPMERLEKMGWTGMLLQLRLLTLAMPGFFTEALFVPPAVWNNIANRLSHAREHFGMFLLEA